MVPSQPKIDPKDINKEYPYLSNVKAPPQLLGLSPLLNPLTDHVSAQRLNMYSQHLPQAQILAGAEMPRLFSGYEGIVGEYEHDPTERDKDVQIMAVIPRFVESFGASPIYGNPYDTVIYREVSGDPKEYRVGYFNVPKDAVRSDGYGYEYKKLPTCRQLSEGNFIPKDMKFITSPAHAGPNGERYMLGTNLNVCYIDIPEVTEDAFVISESAAKKLGTKGYGVKSFKILPNQIPLGLYSSETEYKFLPDIGEQVRDDGILYALRTPSETSVVFDTLTSNLHQVQHLHDRITYVPAGATIVDIDVVVNRKVKVSTPEFVFAQVEKYRKPISQYCKRVYETYKAAVNEGLHPTPEFNTLVTRCLASALIDGEPVDGLNNRLKKLKAARKKELVEFIYITVTYKYDKPMSLGKKITNRSVAR